ncbi:unnamed protein product [Ectocarpus sp. 4 AP-2014]
MPEMAPEVYSIMLCVETSYLTNPLTAGQRFLDISAGWAYSSLNSPFKRSPIHGSVMFVGHCNCHCNYHCHREFDTRNEVVTVADRYVGVNREWSAGRRHKQG